MGLGAETRTVWRAAALHQSDRAALRAEMRHCKKVGSHKMPPHDWTIAKESEGLPEGPQKGPVQSGRRRARSSAVGPTLRLRNRQPDARLNP